MSAIHNNTVKYFLVKAEGFIEQNKYAEAVAYATAGLQITLDIAKDFFVADSFFNFNLHNWNELNSIKGISIVKNHSDKSEPSSKLKEGIKNLKDGVKHSLDKIQELDEITLCYCLGINVEQYVRYRKMSGYFSPNASCTEPYEVGSSRFGMRKHNLDKRDAELSLQYCTNTIINIQDTLERFNKPFGDE